MLALSAGILLFVCLACRSAKRGRIRKPLCLGDALSCRAQRCSFFLQAGGFWRHRFAKAQRCSSLCGLVNFAGIVSRRLTPSPKREITDCPTDRLLFVCLACPRQIGDPRRGSPTAKQSTGLFCLPSCALLRRDSAACNAASKMDIKGNQSRRIRRSLRSGPTFMSLDPDKPKYALFLRKLPEPSRIGEGERAASNNTYFLKKA